MSVNKSSNSQWRHTAPHQRSTVRKEPPPPSLKPSQATNLADDEHVRTLKSLVDSTPRLLVIMRGLPGSGKSYLASKIVKNGTILSTDDYFIDETGSYKFDPRKINDAHASNKARARKTLESGLSPVIIDNTHVKIWEFKPYVKLAVELDYTVRIVEPNTSWKTNANELSRRNQHAVPYEKIRNMLQDFDTNVDLNRMLDEFRPPAKATMSKSISIGSSLSTSTRTSSSSGSEAFDFKSYLNKGEWYLPDIDSNDETAPKALSASLSTLAQFTAAPKVTLSNKHIQTEVGNEAVGKVVNACARVINSKSTSSLSLQRSPQRLVTLDRSCDTSELSEQILEETFDVNLQFLVSLFPSYPRDTICSLLQNHENNLELVAAIVGEDNENAVVARTVFEPMTLKSICEAALNNIDEALKAHYECDEVLDESFEEDFEDESEASGELEVGCDAHRLNDESFEEPILGLKIGKEFATSLFSLFAAPGDKFNEDLELGVDFKLAQELFKCWQRKKAGKVDAAKEAKQKDENRRTMSKKYSIQASYEDNLKQIEEDSQLALEIFELENMRHPIYGYPIYLSDKGVNSAAISLRQIMAEQTAEQTMTKKYPHAANKNIMSLARASTNGKPANRVETDPNMAIKLKRKTLYEHYARKIDTNVIDKIFFEQNYNIEATKNYIENFFQVKKDAPKKFKSKPQELNEKPKSTIEVAQDDQEEEGERYRNLAHKYFQIRQEYYEKASEAHSRGFGAVAQYYAEMGHKQSLHMKHLNDRASINIFAYNNADLQQSNTLDLHGLHVNEALDIFKKVYEQKKRNLMQNGSTQKQKTYLYVITGCGRHSSNRVAKIRPSVISYLNQCSIRFKEPNIGLLRVDLI